jgi:hypothetical protein
MNAIEEIEKLAKLRDRGAVLTCCGLRSYSPIPSTKLRGGRSSRALGGGNSPIRHIKQRGFFELWYHNSTRQGKISFLEIPHKIMNNRKLIIQLLKVIFFIYKD